MIDFTADSALAIRELANCTVFVKVSGVVVADFPGIFDEAFQAVTAYEAERAIIKPAVTVASTDFVEVTSDHVLQIRDVDYKFDGKPRPDGHGFTVVFLGVRK